MSTASAKESPGYHMTAFRFGIVSMALVSSLVFLHWFVVQPVLAAPGKYELSLFMTLMLHQEGSWAGYPWVVRISLGLAGLSGLAGTALAATIAVRIPDHIAARRLAWSLATGSIAASYFFFLSTHVEYRTAVHWEPDNSTRFALDALAYAAGLLSPLFLARFFISYPRSATPEEWLAHFEKDLAETRAKARSGWGIWFHPDALRGHMANSPGENRWFRFTSDSTTAANRARLVQWTRSPAVVPILLALALVSAGTDWTLAHTAAQDVASVPRIMSIAAWLPALLVFFLAFEVIARSLKFHSACAPVADSAKMDWIKATLISGGFMVFAAQVGAIFLARPVMTMLSERGVFLPGQVFLIWPFIFACQLMVLVFVGALAFSIFYRGAVDPRLAARKITLFGVIGLVVAFLFILIERTVALKIVETFGLEPGTGALIAGAAVAASIAPVKAQAEKFVNAAVSRYLPLESVAVGERKVVAVAMADLSGYTALSSRDEPQALLLAALLQRQANKIAADHRGRVVKSMGDAVMFAFDVPGLAVAALRTLHANFGLAAEQLGLAPLAVHSGAHLGEVTETADGDLYGQTVNLAARLQGVAAPGQCVLSEALARAAALAPIEQSDLGAQRLKNVPEPINCVALAVHGSVPASQKDPR